MSDDEKPVAVRAMSDEDRAYQISGMRAMAAEAEFAEDNRQAERNAKIVMQRENEAVKRAKIKSAQRDREGLEVNDPDAHLLNDPAALEIARMRDRNFSIGNKDMDSIALRVDGEAVDELDDEGEFKIGGGYTCGEYSTSDYQVSEYKSMYE